MVTKNRRRLGQAARLLVLVSLGAVIISLPILVVANSPGVKMTMQASSSVIVGRSSVLVVSRLRRSYCRPASGVAMMMDSHHHHHRFTYAAPFVWNDEKTSDGSLYHLQRQPISRIAAARRFLASSIPRGGASSGDETEASSARAADKSVEYETNAEPAPGSPFHYAFPVHSLEAAKDFYGRVLGCEEGRSSEKWQDYSLHGHQIVCHWVGNDYRCVDYYNPVDGDEVPVPHAGLALTVEQFHDLADRVRQAGIHFIIEPHLRFKGMPGEQYTMFFKDPSGNNLEFKSMTRPQNLFAKYNV